MDFEIIQQATAEFIKEKSFGDLSKLTNETLIFREGYFDSMGFVSLIAFLEEKYSIQINENDLIEDNFESINAISSFVIKKATPK